MSAQADLLRAAADRAGMVIDPLGVALATADWLEATAKRCENPRNHGWRGSRQALAVARAILEVDA